MSGGNSMDCVDASFRRERARLQNWSCFAADDEAGVLELAWRGERCWMAD